MLCKPYTSGPTPRAEAFSCGVDTVWRLLGQGLHKDLDIAVPGSEVKGTQELEDPSLQMGTPYPGRLLSELPLLKHRPGGRSHAASSADQLPHWVLEAAPCTLFPRCMGIPSRPLPLQDPFGDTLKKLMDQIHNRLEMLELSRDFGTQNYEQQVVELSQAGKGGGRRGGPGGWDLPGRSSP